MWVYYAITGEKYISICTNIYPYVQMFIISLETKKIMAISAGIWVAGHIGKRQTVLFSTYTIKFCILCIYMVIIVIKKQDALWMEKVKIRTSLKY